MSQSSRQKRTLASALTVAVLLAVAPASQAAGALGLTSRVTTDPGSTRTIGARVAIADLNGDGIDDHAIAESDLVTVYFGAPGSVDGGGTLKLTAGFSGTFNPSVSAAGDFDGDGIDDLVITPSIGALKAFVLYGATTNPASLALGAATERVTPITIGTWGSQTQPARGIGDFDGDGTDDLIVPSTTGSGPTAGTSNVAIVAGGMRVPTLSATGTSARVSILQGWRNCTTVFSYSFPYFRQSCSAPEPAVTPVGDFNGDRKADLYVDVKANQAPWIVPGRAGSGTTIPGTAPGAGSTNLGAIQSRFGSSYISKGLRLGDIDGDGFDDFGLSVNSGAGGGDVAIRGRANPPATLPVADSILRVPNTGIGGTAGDQTGDGRADVLVSGGDVRGIELASLPAGSSTFTLSSAGWPPSLGASPGEAAGDLDGDGALDLLLWGEGVVYRLTHGTAPVEPAKARLSVSTFVLNDSMYAKQPENNTLVVDLTVTTTCNGRADTRSGTTPGGFVFGEDDSLSVGDRCTVSTTQELPSEPPLFENCTWTHTATFRGEPVSPTAAVTIGPGANDWRQRFLCIRPPVDPVDPKPNPFPLGLSGGWQQSGSAGIANETLRLTTGPNQTGSAVWPKPLKLTGKTFKFTVTMAGGNGAAEGLTVAFLNNVGGKPGGLLGAGGGQLGFGGLAGSAIAFDSFKQAEDAQANTLSFVDGVNGSSLRKLYTKDAGVNMRGKTITWTVAVGTDGKVRAANDRGISHVFEATLPDTAFLAFTGSTGTVWQNQTVAGLSLQP